MTNSENKWIYNEIKIFIALFHRFIGFKCVYITIIWQKRYRVTYGLDHWTLRLFFGAFLGAFFGLFFWTILSGGGGGRQTISTLTFCHVNAKLAPKHWTIIVIEKIANSCFRSSSVKSCVCLFTRLVPVLNDTHRLVWIIFQLPHVFLFVCAKKSEEKARWFYKWFHIMECNPAVNETLLTYPSPRW